MNPDRIRAIRAQYQETQEEFSRRVGVSVDTVRSWEQMRSAPSRLAIDRLLQVERSAPKDPLLAVGA